MLTLHDLLALTNDAPVALCSDWLRAFLAASRVEAKITPKAEQKLAAKPGAVAVVPVYGVITPKPTPWEQYGLTTSGQTVLQNVRAALAAPDVKAVVLDIDSPGGSTFGMTETFAELHALRGAKPIIAQANHLAASAAYWLGAAADEFVASPSAVVGSIGVYMLHVDSSEALAQMGLKAEFIHAGKDKVLANGIEPLTEEGRAYLQKQVDDAYASFTRDVATGRGVSQAVASSETFGAGRVFGADVAKTRGLVDKVRTMEATLAAYGVTASSSAMQRRARMASLLEL